MTLERKLIIIGIISFVLSVASFFYFDGTKNPNVFINIFEILMLTGLTFLILAINFFALVFSIKKVKAYLAHKKAQK